jgi:hypothetical protein
VDDFLLGCAKNEVSEAGYVLHYFYLAIIGQLRGLGTRLGSANFNAGNWLRLSHVKIKIASLEVTLRRR